MEVHRRSWPSSTAPAASTPQPPSCGWRQNAAHDKRDRSRSPTPLSHCLFALSARTRRISTIKYAASPVKGGFCCCANYFSPTQLVSGLSTVGRFRVDLALAGLTANSQCNWHLQDDGACPFVPACRPAGSPRPCIAVRLRRAISAIHANLRERRFRARSDRR
jgi:hypothetical protein